MLLVYSYNERAIHWNEQEVYPILAGDCTITGYFPKAQQHPPPPKKNQMLL